MQIICICTYLWASVRPVLCFYIDICMQTNEEAYRHAHILKCKYICIHMCTYIYCLFIYIYISLSLSGHICIYYIYIYHSTAISGRSAVTLKASCIYLYTYTHLQYVLIYLFSFVIYIYLLITYFFNALSTRIYKDMQTWSQSYANVFTYPQNQHQHHWLRHRRRFWTSSLKSRQKVSRMTRTWTMFSMGQKQMAWTSRIPLDVGIQNWNSFVTQVSFSFQKLIQPPQSQEQLDPDERSMSFFRRLHSPPPLPTFHRGLQWNVHTEASLAHIQRGLDLGGQSVAHQHHHLTSLGEAIKRSMNEGWRNGDSNIFQPYPNVNVWQIKDVLTCYPI